MRSLPLVTKSAATLALILTVAAAPPVVRQIDVARSKATFSVQHIWVENVVGTVPIVRGSLTLQGGSLIPQAVSATLDSTRIKTDEPDRDRALESSDFFDARQFPHWTFDGTKIVPNGAGAFQLYGILTVHGQARPEVLDVTVSGTLEHPRYHAVGHLDRHAFGMTRTRLDPTIGSIVTVTLDVTVQ